MTSNRADGVAVDFAANVDGSRPSPSVAGPQLPPVSLHGYDVLAIIEDGGSSTVYRGCRTGAHGFRRDVAIKVLHPHLRRRPDAVKRFYREARLGARLRHPHVVPVLDLGPSTDAPFMVMEWIEGVDLARLARFRRPSWPVIGRVLADALLGLHAVHELADVDGGPPLGLVHRDFSPANLLVGVDGLTRLTDLGISRPPTERITTTGIVQGTVPYLSPEQCRGEALDRRSDVWSAGAVAVELLGGMPLIQASLSPAAAVARIASGDYPSIREIAPHLPSALADAVDRALDPDPTARWATADAFRRAMVAGFEREESLASSEEVAATVKTALALSRPSSASVPIPSPTMLIGPSERFEVDNEAHRVRAWSVTTAAVLVALGAAWGTVQWVVDRSPSPTRAAHPRLEGDAASASTAVRRPVATVPSVSDRLRRPRASDRGDRPPAASPAPRPSRAPDAPPASPRGPSNAGPPKRTPPPKKNPPPAPQNAQTAATRPSAPPLAPNPYAHPKQD